MVKKLLAFIMVGLLGVSVVGCSGNSTTDDKKTEKSTENTEDTAAENDEIFAVMVLPNVSEVVYSDWAEAARVRFEEAGIKYEVAACEDDVNIMNQQIDNYVVMGCTHMFVQQISFDAQSDSLKAAVEQGVDVFVVNDGEDKDSYTSVVAIDQYTMGDNIAKAAAEWIDETYPDAADKSVECAIFGTLAFDHVTPRTEALSNIEKYTSKAVIVENYDYGASTQPNKDAQDWIENVLIKYPDVKCVIGEAGTVLEMNEIIMDEDSIDKATFGMFTDTESAAMFDAIAASAENKSVVRGLCTFDSIGESFFKYVTDKESMKIDGQQVWIDLFVADADNVADYMK